MKCTLSCKLTALQHIPFFHRAFDGYSTSLQHRMMSLNGLCVLFLLFRYRCIQGFPKSFGICTSLLHACVFMAFCTLGKSQYLRGQVTTQEPLLSHGDVAIDDPGKTTMVHIRLKLQRPTPFVIALYMDYVGKTGNELCPVAAITAYLAIRGTTSGPFFFFEDGTPLTWPRFVEQVCLILCQTVWIFKWL